MIFKLIFNFRNIGLNNIFCNKNKKKKKNFYSYFYYNNNINNNKLIIQSIDHKKKKTTKKFKITNEISHFVISHLLSHYRNSFC